MSDPSCDFLPDNVLHCIFNSLELCIYTILCEESFMEGRGLSLVVLLVWPGGI
jgi:hypothetical protein